MLYSIRRQGLRLAALLFACFSLSAESSLAQRFDVDLELHSIRARNVSDLSGKESVFGMLGYIFHENPLQLKWLWTAKEPGINFTEGQRRTVEKSERIRTGIGIVALRNLAIAIGGDVVDDEGVLPSRWFKCDECDGGMFRKVDISKFPTTQSSITSMLTKPKGQFYELKFGEDNFLEVNFYENGNKEDGWVTAYYKVWVRQQP